MKTSERVALLDVNVLIALLDAGHVHHLVAHDWFKDNDDPPWASCALTENGAIRILATPSRVEDFLPIPTLVDVFKRFCAQTRHHFWPDDVSLADGDRFDVAAIHGHRQITDVYLLALAVKNDGRLVTFDQRVPLPAVKGARREHLEVLAPA